jgi:hypothetical protein
VHLKSDPTRVVALGESDFIRAINIFQVYQVLHYLHSTFFFELKLEQFS